MATFNFLICSSSSHAFNSYSSYLQSQSCAVITIRSLFLWYHPTPTAMNLEMLLTLHGNGFGNPSLSLLNLELKSSWFNCFTSLMLGACREPEWWGMSIIIIPFHTENCVGFILNFLIAFSCKSIGQYHQVSFTLGLGVRLNELDVPWNMILKSYFC